ncbi:hypothetical protein QLQ12_39345 [Actinoplanes sp. NEAU-A12]|uniref:Uncharacterized protein n=1 Tax=Actinoplanes sandaracinus TaxID=3045177 RepID=A0ABT6WY40_9ACTN|nr:hypothetical protein [Actinoplanes sandaracinus]MDI6104665.1 hypothetical protein [Actinoplanes sandaracinus]
MSELGAGRDPSPVVDQLAQWEGANLLLFEDGTDHEGDRTTVRRDSVEVIIQAPKQWRDRIAATIHQVRVDDAGCPASHRISTGPDLRPTPPGDVATLRDVTSVSVCKYPLPHGISASPSSPRLLSSLRLDGPAAADEIRRIAVAARWRRSGEVGADSGVVRTRGGRGAGAPGSRSGCGRVSRGGRFGSSVP